MLLGMMMSACVIFRFANVCDCLYLVIINPFRGYWSRWQGGWGTRGNKGRGGEVSAMVKSTRKRHDKGGKS